MAQKSAARPPRTAAKNAVQEVHRRWVRELERKTGLQASQIAKDAGLGSTTLWRLFQPNYAGTLSSVTVETLKERYGVPGPDELQAATAAAPVLGFGEGEELRDAAIPPELGRFVEALKEGRNAPVEVWQIKTRALDMAGILPGDLVAVDGFAEPRAGDVVLAIQRASRDDPGETLFRVFERPFLVAHSTDPSVRRPILVDDRTAIIRGVVVGLARPWRQAHN